jgi:hypothetical protein
MKEPDPMADVALLSNHKTRNLGNLALTQVVQRLLVERYGVEHVVALHRLPHPIADIATRPATRSASGRQSSPLWPRSRRRRVGRGRR